MLTDAEEFFCRLSMLEDIYVMELAFVLANLTPEQSEDFKVGWLSEMRNPHALRIVYLNPSAVANAERESEMQDRAIEIAENFIEKVSAREQRYRAMNAPRNRPPC
jgi:hypothetical protein